MLYTNATKNDTEQRFVTFNKAIFSNSRQCSGLVILEVLEQVPQSSYMLDTITNRQSSTTIKKRNKNWWVNGLRDMRTDFDNPIWLKDWESIKAVYPIDKVLNESTMDKDKDWMEREPFRDKYLLVRLIFDNKNDIKLLTNHTIASEQSTNM